MSIENPTKRGCVPNAEAIIDRYFPVLDYGFVALKDYMGGDKSIEDAARNSYGHGTRKVSETRGLLRYLMRHEHNGPFEFCKFTLHVGMPLFVARQLFRHRTFGINELSARYSIVPLMFYEPPDSRLKLQSKTNKQGSGAVAPEIVREGFKSAYEEVKNASTEAYVNAINDDIAREIARINLPQSTYTMAYVTIDLRNMMNLLYQRMPEHGPQEETRAFARVFGGICQRLAPITIEAFSEYKLSAVRLSQKEINALCLMQQIGITPKAAAIENGITGREIQEFVDKIKIREIPNLYLNDSETKPYSYFEALAKEYAVEELKNDEVN